MRVCAVRVKLCASGAATSAVTDVPPGSPDGGAADTADIADIADIAVPSPTKPACHSTCLRQFRGYGPVSSHLGIATATTLRGSRPPLYYHHRSSAYQPVR